jgi:hypothetical protein
VASNAFPGGIAPLQATTVQGFADALEASNYTPAPGDWLIAVGDVVGSTSAIAAGRYKDVNLAGAATIVGLLNACPGHDLPFAFGGDGGVVLVPAPLEHAARAALKGVQQIARNALALDMRCALVPVSAIRAQGFDVRIVLHALQSGRKLAMLAGGGIDCAEALCKSESGAPFAVSADGATIDADLSGLSCRWQPLLARRGVMLTAIIRARSSDVLPAVYRDLYERVQAAMRHDACPVALTNLKSSWPPRGAARERAFGRTLFEVYGQSLLGKISEISGVTIGGFDGRAYARALPAHSDYRKFADSLRMVVDCSSTEADVIETILKRAKAANEIDFGVHRASSALMTCFVSNTDDSGHVHFIDGADGGYALAAQGLRNPSTGST